MAFFRGNFSRKVPGYRPYRYQFSSTLFYILLLTPLLIYYTKAAGTTWKLYFEHFVVVEMTLSSLVELYAWAICVHLSQVFTMLTLSPLHRQTKHTFWFFLSILHIQTLSIYVSMSHEIVLFQNSLIWRCTYVSIEGLYRRRDSIVRRN